MTLSAEDLFIAAFKTQRDARSNEYKHGVHRALRFRINGEDILCPYLEGTAASDAYYAGTQEGHAIWRCATEKAED